MGTPDLSATFDYTIVGAGSAGCVLAARLTENPAAEAVLDAQLQVHGLSGLRVVDCSSMPTIPGGNTTYRRSWSRRKPLTWFSADPRRRLHIERVLGGARAHETTDAVTGAAQNGSVCEVHRSSGACEKSPM